MKKLGIVAGGGGLPAEIADRCRRTGRPYFVIRLRGFADEGTADHPSADIGIAELGKVFKTLRAKHCVAVCFVGTVARPDFGKLKPDLRGVAALPSIIAAARKGDDALLRAVLDEFRKEGFEIEGAHEAARSMTLPLGRLGAVSPGDGHGEDIQRALTAARAIGRLDIGQGAVVCDGLVLAVEAQEGTDAMLRRVRELPEAIRGGPGRARGVLAKAPKPIQATEVDMPTIGVATVRAAAQAGLAGIVGEAGRLLVVDREETVAMADDLGLFILGVETKAE
ncbi:MAG: UDP-2,3-diacylglucosamine diphosphatase LpxI [Caulobacter sp.]|nr:UDP-2,3-diacylglucosamine diphosphatase LpxI [Caulobacter sp.]